MPQGYIGGPLLENLGRIVAEAMGKAGIAHPNVRVEVDASDESSQSLLFWYPSVIEVAGDTSLLTCGGCWAAA